MPLYTAETYRVWLLVFIACWSSGECLFAFENASNDASVAEPRSRQEILEHVGLWPLPEHRPSVAAICSPRRNYAGYSVENVALETAPGCYITGNLYRPLLRHDLGPAVLLVDELDSGQRFGDERQILCAHLARSGVAVLACNAQWSARSDSAAPQNAIPLVSLWNQLRAVDFLVTLDRIDATRIGVIARGGGETQQVDARIQVVAPEPVDLSPAGREAIYRLFGQRFRLQADPFYAETFTRPREPAPQHAEDQAKVTLESREQLTQQEAGTRLMPQGFTDVQAASLIAKYADELRAVTQTTFAPVTLSGTRRATYTETPLQTADESIVFTPPGFHRVGQSKVAVGPDVGRLEISVHDLTSGRATPCRINVVGPDGNYYEPADNPLKEHSYTAEWPAAGWGNRTMRAPVRYLGRSFYTTGPCVVDVPAGVVRVEVWKGFEYRPETTTVVVPAGGRRKVEIELAKAVPADKFGYWSGDPHIHVQRRDEADQARVFDLLECEDTHFGAVLAYNEPPGPYRGAMEYLDSPQMFGLGRRSVATRGEYAIISGQEYRSSHYGHMNLLLHDSLVLEDQSLDADRWPPFGHVARSLRESGGLAAYAHGGYAQEIYADVAQGDVTSVELLQHGVYRGIGLEGWYRMLNAGYRVSANGAADYPACRMLADCKTYVSSADRPTMEEWLRGMDAGRSFFTSGPILLMEVDGNRPGATIDNPGATAARVKVSIRVRSEVAPVTHVELVANGRIVDELLVPASQGQGSWIELERVVELTGSAWIAARAYSLSALGAANAEAHTNPVYVYLDGKAPFDQESLDGWLAALDQQIEVQRARRFAEQARALDYYERSRDILTRIRAAGGVSSAGRPWDVAKDLPTFADPTARAHSEESLRAVLRPLPAKPFEAFVNSIETQRGFELQPVAREPMVFDPIAAAFDEDGQLYVCEMRDYPYKPAAGKQPLGAVRLLSDTDGDGAFDESHVFAEHLLWAGGIAPWRGGVFVAAPPDIWYLKDTDGDHCADIRRQVFTGFGTQNQQAMLNNLVMGLDHRIYGSTAGNGGKIRCVELPAGGKPPERPAVDVHGRDFRFDPETGDFESITGTMQFGNCFDDWGNRFLCSESQPLLHAVLPQRYLVRNPYLPVPSALQNIAPGPVPIFRISPVERWRIIRSSRRIAHGERAATSPGASHHVIDAAAGVTVYRGGAYPPEFYGNVFVTDAQNNLIHRRTLATDGVTFKSERADAGTEFVRSSDNWFRPVNLLNAPDGTLYVLDMSREILETIHVPSDVAQLVDFTSGREHGRIFRLAPPGISYPGPPRLGQATSAELVDALASPHGWQRDTAHRLLYERRDLASAEPMRKLLTQGPTPQARLHALWSLAGLGVLTNDDLALALSDESTAIREHAMQLSESRLDDAPILRDRIISQLADAPPRIRFQAAFSLGEWHDPRAARALATIARTSAADPWLRTAVLSSANESASELLAELLADKAFTSSDDGQQLALQLAFVVGARNKSGEASSLLERLAALDGDDGTSWQPLVIAMARGLQQSGAYLEGGALSEAARTYLQRMFDRARATAGSESSDIATRQTAIDLIGSAPFAESRDTLAELLDVRQPAAVQIAAVNALAEHPDREVGKLLLENWSESTPDVRAAITAGMLKRVEWSRQLLEAATNGEVSLAHLDMTQRALLTENRDEVVRSLARQTLDNADGSREEVVASYAASMTANADQQRGEAVFRRECMVCHRIGDIGRAVGPDLTSSTYRDRDALLTHVLDPNRHVLPNFENYVCVDTSGRVATGILSAQTATSITLLRQEGDTSTILRANIDELVSSGKSLMPEGFERNITTDDMADLLAFLQSSQGPADSIPLEIGTTPGMVEPYE